MAHEALVSLNLIIDSLINIIEMAHEAQVSLHLTSDSFPNIPKYRNFDLLRLRIKSLQKELWSSKSILELDHFEESERLIALKEEILEAIPKIRDLIKKCQVLSSDSHRLGGGSSNELIFSQDVEKVSEEIISFNEKMKKINKEYNAKDLETSNKVSPLADPDDEDVDMVGVYDEDLQPLIYKLTGQDLSLLTISVVGMAGIGKTTIVKALYDEPYISDYFDCRAFIRIGPDYHLKYILLDLLVCLFPNFNKILGIKKSEQELREQIYKFIKCKRYLIVLDDVWDYDFLDDITRFLPYERNGSKIIITTRLLSLAFEFTTDDNIHHIPFLNQEESWNLFCRKVFVPPGLEKAGKKIVKKCEGLPLGIISIANILSKAEKTFDYWEKVANNENLFALATEEGSPMSESLFLSYKHLPQHLKECFLYIGVFPLNHEISVSKLVKLWVGEGLVQPTLFRTFEEKAREYLEDLVYHYIVLMRQRSSSGRVKTCGAHYFFWHLCVGEAENKKIFHIIKSYPSAFSEGIHSQRRLCIHRNALLGFKCVSQSIESVSNVRSFLCTGPEHQYPVSICSCMTSIKVLDALTIRLYKFPIGILELVELKYLAFTYDGKLPSSISRLKNLIYLIVHQYHRTIINSSPFYMPIEIWNMQELMHLQVMGSDLPHPVDGAQLPNLLTLLGVSDRSFTKEVLQSIPNLRKLGVQIVLSRGVYETLHIYDHLALLSELKSFKYIVSNPNPRSQQTFHFPESVFSHRLTKLTLSGCGFAWEDMSMIGALANLQVLKLRCYAFQGPEWLVDVVEFPRLEYLLLEDIDLVHLRVGSLYFTDQRGYHGCFPVLKRLVIRHCYKLEEIISEFGREDDEVIVIELVDCNLSALASAIHILEEKRNYDKKQFQVRIYSSLDDEKH